jgi:hypothetical protein
MAKVILDIFCFDSDMVQLLKGLLLPFTFFLAIYEDEGLAIMF